MVELKRKSQKKKKQKNAAAVCEYRIDYDGEWGEVSFDFVQGTAEIVNLAELDTIKSNIFAKRAIRRILSLKADIISKEKLLHFIS